MPYAPYLISGFQTAKHIGLEPWKIPSDAFETLLNCRVDKGVLFKRPGYALIDTASAGLPIMGFGQAFSQGTSSLLVADTKRLYKFDPKDSTPLEDVTGSDTFTGEDYHYFRFANWQNKTYMTNWHDTIYIWDDLSQSLAAMDTGSDVTVNRAAIIFVWKNRLHMINTVEGGNDWNPTRWRWTDVLSDNCTSSNYIDGEFDDTPQCVAFIRGVPYVFFKRFVVPLRYSRNPSSPFAWGEAITDVGSVAQNFCIPTQDGVFIWNLQQDRNLDFFDGYRGRPSGYPKQIRGLADSLDIRKWHYMVATRARHHDYLYLTYAEDGNDYPNRILEYNLIENSFSDAGIAMHCIYGHDGFYAPEWDNAPNVFNANFTSSTDVSQVNLSTEFQLRIDPVVYGGDRSGNIYDLNSGTDFNGSDITVQADTARLNPYTKEGRQAALSHVDFLVDTDANASFTVGFYKNTASSTFKSSTLSCSGNNDKHWESLYANGETGDFFRLRFSHTASANAPRLHAMRFWFKRAGLMYNAA